MSGYITGQTIHVDGGTQAAGGWYHHPETGDYALGQTSSSVLAAQMKSEPPSTFTVAPVT